MTDKNEQIKADMAKLTESYLKGKSKEDPSVTDAQKKEFSEFMSQVTDAVLKQRDQK